MPKYELTEKGHVKGCPCCPEPTVDEKLKKLIPPERQRRIDALKEKGRNPRLTRRVR